MKFITVLFLLAGFVLFAQDDHKYRHFELGAQGYVFQASDFYSSNFETSYITSGAGLNIAFGMFQSRYFKMDCLLGYHFVSKYGKYEGVGYTEDKYLPYHGGYTGFGFRLGNQHQFESRLLFGGGAFFDSKTNANRASMEMSTELGYRFDTQFGLSFRTGAGLNLGRNAFWSPMYGGYLGVGYVFKDNSIDGETETKHYPAVLAFSLNGYIGSVNEELFGSGFRFDHYLWNTDAFDVGYVFEFRAGVSYDESLLSLSAGVSFLMGPGSHKFELNFGPNFPLRSSSYVNTEFYEVTYVGIGYRYAPIDKPYFFRVSSATTSVFNLGFGLSLGR